MKLLALLLLLATSVAHADGNYAYFNCGGYRLTRVTGDYNYDPADFDRLEQDVNNRWVEIQDFELSNKGPSLKVISINKQSTDLTCSLIGGGYNGGAG